ncbi:MAG: hypothetical protein WD944_01565 [Steroidobacteraceae bacterium]
MTGRNHRYWRWTWTLALMLSVAPTAWPLDPPATTGRAMAVEDIVKSWESVDARLTSLLSELPSDAHSGIQRAIEANRQGRERAMAELESAGADSTAGRERAQQALADAATRAARGLDEARAHVPNDVLPRLDEAAARMRDGLAKAAGAVATAAPAAAPASRPQTSRRARVGGSSDVARPGGVPAGVGRPSDVGKPQTPGRPGDRS